MTAMVAQGVSKFRLMTPKDIAQVLNILGMHPPVTSETIEHPNQEATQAIYQALCSFVYDVDPKQVKAPALSVLQNQGFQFPQVYDEGMDQVTISKLVGQIAVINGLQNFNLKDMWEPNPKRFRKLGSAMINFCRYKDGRVEKIEGMRAVLQAQEAERVDLADRLNDVEQRVAADQEQHARDLHEIREAEAEAQRARSETDKDARQAEAGERVVQEVKGKKDILTAKIRGVDETNERVREQIAHMRNQIAKSPEGLQQEISQLNGEVQERRRNLQQKVEEKRCIAQHDQLHVKILRDLSAVREDFNLDKQSEDDFAAVRSRRSALGAEVSQKQKTRKELRDEDTELEQRIEKRALDGSRAKEDHEATVKELKGRRHKALEQHEELQAKRMEQQKQSNLAQAKRSELEAALVIARRDHEARIASEVQNMEAIRRDAEEYMRNLQELLARRGGTNAAAQAPPPPPLLTAPPATAPPAMAEVAPLPGSAKKERVMSPSGIRQRMLGSPSPARLASNPMGFLSPGAPY